MESKSNKDEKRRVLSIIILIMIIIISMYLGYILGKIIEPLVDEISTPSEDIIIAEMEEDDNDEDEDNLEDEENVNDDEDATYTNYNSSNTSSSTSNTNSNSTNNNSEEETTVELKYYDIQLDEAYASGETIKTNTDTLELFNFSSIYVVNGKIAPGSTGSYNFYITNKCNFDIKYKIEFTEENISDINMKFRLKIDGSYISRSWSDLETLTTEYKDLSSESQVFCNLEWKWVDSSNDTSIGIIGGTYELGINIYAKSK